MPTQLTKAFKCDHCGKLYQREHFCEKHEHRCKKNPINFHPCWQCIHLRKTQWTDDTGQHFMITRRGFLCQKKDVEMYSYRFEKTWNYKTGDFDAERMPTTCEQFDDSDHPKWDSEESLIKF